MGDIPPFYYGVLMKPYKKTKKAWEMTIDKKPKGELKKVINRIERRKIKEETNEQIADWQDMKDSFNG